MPKRKKQTTQESSKKKKLDVESDESGDKTTLTKQPKKNQKERLPWPDADIFELITRIEKNIPEDDSLSYSSRLDKLKWENIAFESHQAKECQEVWAVLYKQVRKFRLLREIVTDIKQWVHTPKTSPLKHPNKPKQPLNSYLLFVEDKREEVMDQNPTLTQPAIAKKLGQMFRNLPISEKQRYEEQAKVARMEYLEKLQLFYKQHPHLVPKKRDERRKSDQVKIVGEPELPKTPFELFLQVESEKETANASRFVVGQKCRERWNQLTDKEKMFWINWAEEQHAKYIDDLKEYLRSHPDYEPKKIKTVLTKKEKKIKDRCSGKPEKPPHGPYNLFSKMLLESDEVKGISGKDAMNYVSEKWKTCSEDEKSEYKTRVEQMWEEYHVKLEEYVMTLPPEDRDRIREESRKKGKTEERIVKRVQEKTSTVKLKKPEQPPLSDYKYFVSVYKGKENPAIIWKSMDDKEKQVFAEKLTEEKRKYIALYEQYLKSLSREELEKLGEELRDQSTSSESSQSVSEEETDEED